MKNVSLTERLNDAIERVGPMMGPALTNLLLHGPLNRDLISDENYTTLEDRANSLEDCYYRHVFPKVGEVARVLTKSKLALPNNSRKLDACFIRKTSEQIRQKFRNSYRNQFELDDTTKSALFSDEKICNRYGKKLKYFFDDKNGFIISKRYKEPDKMAEKYAIKFDKLNGNERDTFLNFVVDIAENNYASWSNYNDHLKLYGENSMEMMLGDIFGIKINDMNQKRAEENMERLAKIGPSIKFPNFVVVGKLFEDHRKRNKKMRPGGIHYTLIDKSLPNYPVEIQIRSIKDGCFNLFGKCAHYLYSLSGKKANDVYVN